MTPEQIAEVRRQSWLRGYLRWKLREHAQRDLYDFINEWKGKNPTSMGPIVYNCHRRLGKTRLGLVIGIERCLKKPDQEARLIAPSIDLCEKMVRPQLDQVMRGAPECLWPRPKGNSFKFFNPAWGIEGAYSTLYLEGSEYKKGNRQRGLGSHFVALDEFRDMEDPATLIDEIIAYHFVDKEDPLLLILSTPPHTMDHPMVRRFIPRAQAKKAYRIVTVDDNPDFSKEDERMLLEICETKDSISWRREAMCELISDPKNLIIPEFVEAENIGKIDEIVVDHYEWPTHYYPQVCIDTGYDDYNGVTFYFIDWAKQLFILVGELWVHQQNSRDLKEMIEEAEKKIFPNPPYPITRQGDLPKQHQADLAEIFQFIILPVNKTEKIVQINSLRRTVRQRKIRIVGPSCPITIYQLRNGSYAKNRKDFVRREADDELGHCDLLASLIYGHRQAPWDANPFPRDELRIGVNSILIPSEEDEKDTLEIEEETEYMIN